jgi:hypothetical protein
MLAGGASIFGKNMAAGVAGIGSGVAARSVAA